VRLLILMALVSWLWPLPEREARDDLRRALAIDLVVRVIGLAIIYYITGVIYA